MNKFYLLFSCILVLICGCQGANIASQIRQTQLTTGMNTRCETFDTRDASAMTTMLKKYDGWNAFYVSEFTTGNMTGASGLMCFERPNK